VIFASSHVLGIAVTDRSIAIAEVTGKGADRMVRRAATFTLPPEVSFEDPQTIGQVLGRFLKEKGFSASRAVVGIPAKWLIAVEKEVPPASREQIKSLLRLQAERLALADSGEIVYDYAGENPSGKPGKVLLVAMLRKQLERITQAMDEAGLSVVAVTATGLALSNASTKAAQAGQPMIFLGRHGAEVVVQSQGTPRMLKHFSVAATNGHGVTGIGPLGMEVRRAVTMAGAAPVNGQPAGSPELYLYDAVGLEDEQLSELSDKVGMKVRSDDGLATLGVKTLVRATPGSSDEGSPQRYAAAVALAVVGGETRLLPLNFAKSRLAPPPVRKYGRKTVWSVAIASLIVIAIGGLFADNYLEQTRLSDIKANRERIKAQYTEAKRFKDQVEFSNLYYKQRTPAMECLRELTLTFHVEDPIWASNLTIKEERDGRDLDKLEGQFDGKTTDPNVPWVLVDRMRGNPKFDNVSARNINVVPANSRQRETLYTYQVVFTFNPNRTPTTAPAGTAR
jgi:hypothetical protein